ncbi:MAG: arylsulfatase [Rhodospirillaceae bacterium]|nr:arylsulfatase [Rhodospirillaceae bacterium]MDE0000741.1 arylsulfatase [Rhodospirillaceae bacterium]
MSAQPQAHVALAAVLSLAACAAAGQERPNILLIMADDLGWGDIGYNRADVRTPTLDRLAAEGIRLDRYYTHPSCTPTRTAFYSGKRAVTLGTIAPIAPWEDFGLPPGERILPQYLQEAGYTTWLVGKWHLGHHYHDQHPLNRGYDHFYGANGGEINYYTHALNRVPDWERNGEALDEEGYVTHLLRDEAIGLIEGYDGDAPYFMHLSFTAPHTPLQAPEESVLAYSDITDFNRRRLAAMITEMDAAIGDVLRAIADRPDSDSTLIVFVSDNGGELRAGSVNAPLRGNKMSLYEGGIRVPALLHWPSRLEGGRAMDTMATVYDWIPTLLSVAGHTGVADSDLDGVDLWPTIDGSAEPQRDRPIVITSATPAGPRIAVIEDGWKLIRSLRPLPETPGEFSVELFNILADPSESSDLAAREPERTSRLLAYIDTISIAQVLGGTPPPEDYDGASGPEIEPDNRPPIYPPVADSVTERPPGR